MKKKKERILGTPKKRGKFFTFFKGLLRIFTRKPKIINLNDKIEDRAIYLSNHSGSSGPFTDWVHAASKVPMIKMQHPEYETFIDGTHGAAGVSCADCHMPYQRVDGKKVSSHWMTSPLKDPELRACRQCHADKTADYLRGRVLYTQEKTYRQLLTAKEDSVRAHEAVRLANAGPAEQRAANYDSLMAEAREKVRKDQLYWD